MPTPSLFMAPIGIIIDSLLPIHMYIYTQEEKTAMVLAEGKRTQTEEELAGDPQQHPHLELSSTSESATAPAPSTYENNNGLQIPISSPSGAALAVAGGDAGDGGGDSSWGMTEDTEEREEGEAYREWAHDDEDDDEEEEEEEEETVEGGDKKPKKKKAKGTYILPTLQTPPTGGKHMRRTLTYPWSKINLALTVGSFAYAATTTFLQVPLNYYIIQDLKLDGRATNVASSTMVSVNIYVVFCDVCAYDACSHLIILAKSSAPVC